MEVRVQADQTLDPMVKALQDKLKAESQLRSGAQWFYWIAAMSVINSLLVRFGSGWGFAIGLGTTQLIDAVVMTSPDAGPVARVVGTVLTALLTAIFAACGYFAGKRHESAFLFGMTLYALDGAVFLLVKDFLAIAIHVFALFCLVMGLKAKHRLERLEKAPALATAG